MVFQRVGGPLNAKLAGINSASGADGLGYDNIAMPPSNIGWLPGIKPMMLGNQTNVPRPVTSGGAMVAGPASALTLAAVATASVFPAGTYSFAYSVVYAGSITVPTQETTLSPSVDITLTALQSVDIGGCIALPGGAIGFRVYMTYAPNIRPSVQTGYVGSGATQAAVNALVISAVGNGVFGPQSDMACGSVMLPVITFASQLTVTVLDARVSANSFVPFALRHGSTTPAVAKKVRLAKIANQAGVGFTMMASNDGVSANSTLSTDFCFDYLVWN